jgi:hypothetical protein
MLYLTMTNEPAPLLTKACDVAKGTDDSTLNRFADMVNMPKGLDIAYIHVVLLFEQRNQ